MSIATVVTRGYGTFGTIPFVVTRGYSIAAVAIRIGPIISQVIFRMDQTTGDFGGKETLGIFREPSDTGRLKP